MNLILKNILRTGLLLVALNTQGALVRVGDQAFVLGERSNQLIGVGLVSGLNTVGDKDPAQTRAALANTLRRFGINLPATSLTSKDIAVVLVTADLPPFAKSGSRIDVTVSAMGDAKSLEGGMLAQTLLYGVDGNVYAIGQGPVAIGGFSLGGGGGGGANVQKNHPLTGQIIGGASVEKTVPVTLVRGNAIELVLRDYDFSNSARMAEAVNAKFPSSAHAVDGGSVRVEIPDTYQTHPIDFVAQLREITFQVDTPARVVINEKTGTIVATARTKISSCAVAHGNIIVQISETLDVSQPSPFAQTGTTQVVPTTQVDVTEQAAQMKAFPEMPTVDRVAAAMNELGATPRDMMAIFQAMKQAGALHAELIVR
ncbi:MAG: flagellar basal body P-ring protein FlgI [Verrucomicrobia bacterium]|jgi:flagellar P-ring protein FlgI|nr:flagellar basal body P-ring protein FlgI [Verrucomicrobiota bacterium]